MTKTIVDTVMMIASLLFCYSLIPTVYTSWKTKSVGINKQTLILTVIGQIMFQCCYVPLGYWFTFYTSIISLACWITLTIFKWKFTVSKESV
jgi:hypothetical protein